MSSSLQAINPITVILHCHILTHSFQRSFDFALLFSYLIATRHSYGFQFHLISFTSRFSTPQFDLMSNYDLLRVVWSRDTKMNMIRYTSDIDDVIFFPNLVCVPSSPSKQIVQINHVLPDVIGDIPLQGRNGFCKVFSNSHDIISYIVLSLSALRRHCINNNRRLCDDKYLCLRIRGTATCLSDQLADKKRMTASCVLIDLGEDQLFYI